MKKIIQKFVIALSVLLICGLISDGMSNKAFAQNGDNIIINGDFADDLDNWTPFLADWEGVAADIEVFEGELLIEGIENADKENAEIWWLQVNQIFTEAQIGELVVGQNYKISFDAKSSEDGRGLRLYFGEDGGGFDPQFILDVELGTDMATFEEVITLDSTYAQMKFGFEMGGSNADVAIANVMLMETDEEPTSIEGTDSEIPHAITLSQNYPNPFNPTTSIDFTLPNTADVTLAVYNMVGQRVATLANGMHSAGTHSVQFDAANLASGMYMYRLQSGNFTITNKMLLIK